MKPGSGRYKCSYYTQRVASIVRQICGTFTMGEDLIASEGLYDPSRGWDFADDTTPVAGEYIATHVDLQGVSSAQLQTLKNRMAQTQAKIVANQPIGLTKEDIYSAVLNYFATNQAASKLESRTAGIVEYRKPSFGNFFTASKTQYWFGIPKNISFPGVTMDIQRYALMNVAKDNSPDTAIAHNIQSGMRLSVYEHVIPEQMFTDPADPNRPQGVSAVKVLALAGNQGQKIYNLNVANQANHAALLAQVTIDPQAMAEIQNALAAGKEVTVHASPITQSGWTGSGYIITDPATGAGAYKITGGANGGALEVGLTIAKWLIGITGVGLAIFGVSTVGASVMALWIATILLVTLIDALIQASLIIDQGGACAVIFSNHFWFNSNFNSFWASCLT
jgi:hypothetical protein